MLRLSGESYDLGSGWPGAGPAPDLADRPSNAGRPTARPLDADPNGGPAARRPQRDRRDQPGYAPYLMDHAAGDGDVVGWVPGPALHVARGVVVAANAAAQDLLGPPEHILDAFAPSDRTMVRARADAVQSSGGTVGPPLLVRLDATPPVRFLELLFGPHPAGGALIVVHDVTERERLDAVIAEFATGVYITDAELVATWIPRRVSESVGLPRDQFVGTDVYSLVHPDDVAPTRALIARARDTPGVRCSRPLRVRQMGQPDVWWPIVVHVIWRGDDPAIGGMLVRFDMDPTAGVHLHGSEQTAQALVTIGPSSTTGALHLSASGNLLQRSTRVREILRPVGDDGDLRWLDLHERESEEASPLGIILCTGKKSEQIELLELDKSGIHVAEYLTTLPPRAVLAERLHQATQRAQLEIEQRKTDGTSP